MAIIKASSQYSHFLNVYERKTGKMPTAEQRTEAFFCSKYNTLPQWMWW